MENSNSYSANSDNKVDLTLFDPKNELKKFVTFLLFRVVGFIGLLFVGVIFANILVDRLPGDPWFFMVGNQITQSKIDWVESQKILWGFYEPFIVRVWCSIRNILTGKWGQSVMISGGSPVLDVIQPKNLRTRELLVFSLLLALPISIWLGIRSGRNKGTRTDRTILKIAGVFFIIPLSTFGIILHYVFALKLNVLPIGSFQSPAYIAWKPEITGFRLVDSLLEGNFTIFLDTFKHLILPSIVLAIGWTAVLIIVIRKFVILQKCKKIHFQSRNYISTFLVFVYISVIYVLIETIFQLNAIWMLTLDALSTLEYFLLFALIIRQLFFFQLTALIVDIIGALVRWRMNSKNDSGSAGKISDSAVIPKKTTSDIEKQKMIDSTTTQNSKIHEPEKNLVMLNWKSMLRKPGILIGSAIILILSVLALSAPLFSDKPSIFGGDIWGSVIWGARIPLLIIFPLSMILGILGYGVGFLLIGKDSILDGIVNYVLKFFLLIPGISILIVSRTIFFYYGYQISVMSCGFIFFTSMMLGHRAIGVSQRIQISNYRKNEKILTLKNHLPHILAYSLILSILVESLYFANSFLGFGDPSVISWGNFIEYSQGMISINPWTVGWQLFAWSIFLFALLSLILSLIGNLRTNSTLTSTFQSYQKPEDQKVVN